MGAWNVGVFDDDDALDCLEEITLCKEPLNYIEKSIKHAIETNYIEYKDCHRVIIASIFIDIIINNTIYPLLKEEHKDIVFIDKNLIHPNLCILTIFALEKVLSKNSELNEMWSENLLEYSKWKDNIRKIITNLNTHL